eukprot:6446601-Amphidinium_carterae.1
MLGHVRVTLGNGEACVLPRSNKQGIANNTPGKASSVLETTSSQVFLGHFLTFSVNVQSQVVLGMIRNLGLNVQFRTLRLLEQ